MNFEQALRLIKAGNKLARDEWRGRDTFLFLGPGPEKSKIIYQSQGHVVPWLCSQADLLAEDWRVLGVIEE